MHFIVPTIDVEAIRSLTREGDFNKLILGEIEGSVYGVGFMADLFRKFEGGGTFFIDFAESTHSEKEIRKLCELIMKKDSEVQLHLHPQFVADIHRPLLHQYSKQEQNETFKEVLQRFRKYTDKDPEIFRAGGYGADDNTLEVIKEFGISTDSSYFPVNPNCRISGAFKLNTLSTHNGTLQFPITLYDNRITYRLLGIPIFKRILRKKLDINGSGLEDFYKVIDDFARKDYGIVDLFMHSYSLISWTADYSEYSPNKEAIDKLKKVLEYARLKGFKLATASHCLTSFRSLFNELSSEIPMIESSRNIGNVFIQYIENAIRKKKRGK